MTTAPKTLINLQARCVKNLGTTNLGIVGDDRHVATGGYHIGADTLRRNGMGGDYSLEFKIDWDSTTDFACAADLGGSSSTLMLLGNRLVHAMKNKDPRVHGKIRAVNAPFDGVSIDRRRDDESPTTTSDDNTQSSDDRGHIHIEIYRTLVTNQSVIDGIYEVLAGIPLRKPSPTSAHKLIVVRSGDSLDRIAHRYHVKGGWQKLQKLNNLKNPNLIRVGQKLRIS